MARGSSKAKGLDMIEANRKELDRITYELVEIVARRTRLVKGIGKAKEGLGIGVVNTQRERAVISNARKLARQMKVDEDLIENIMKMLIMDGRRKQSSRLNHR